LQTENKAVLNTVQKDQNLANKIAYNKI